jgi:hypothetical protein
MAKKRKKEKQEKEGYEYKPPEFNEEEYLRKEIRDTKTLLVTIAYAALIGIASYGVMFTEVALAALLGIIAVVFLRHIYPLIGVDTSSLEKKQWASNIVMYLFTWLAVWILLTNPPFSDLAGPAIKDDKVYFENGPGNWTIYNDETEDKLIGGMNISINVTIADNVEVDPETVTITIRLIDDEITGPGGSAMSYEGSRYWYVFPYNGTGTYAYTISAKDVNNNKDTYTNSINL